MTIKTRLGMVPGQESQHGSQGPVAQQGEQVMGDTFRMSTGQAHELALAFGRNGWTNADIKKLSEGGLLEKVLPVVRGKAEVKLLDDVAPLDPNAWIDELDLATIEHRVFEVTIDPTQTIEQMVAAGGYTYVNPNHTTAIFSSCRKITGTEPVKAKLVAFCIGRNATREQVKRLRARLNLKEVCIQHELALGAQHQDAQRELNWIVNVDDEVLAGFHRCVSSLDGFAGYRNLNLDDAGNEWHDHTWFLGLASEPV